jgi:hypothetical protein
MTRRKKEITFWDVVRKPEEIKISFYVRGKQKRKKAKP